MKYRAYDFVQNMTMMMDMCMRAMMQMFIFVRRCSIRSVSD